MDAATTSALAERIREAERSATPRDPLTADHESMDVSEAYAIQEAYCSMRREAGGSVVGQKIGCTSQAIQERFSIDTPDYGHLFDDMVVPNQGEIDTDDLIAPMVEPEIGFELSEPLKGPDVTADDVLQATERVVPSLEIIDSRIKNWEIAFEDTVADNGSSARCVFGSDGLDPANVDLAMESVRLCRNGSSVYEGKGEDVLGHPAKAVAWLANALSQFDRNLASGHRILSGSMTDAIEVEAGTTYQADFDTLGQVECAFR